METITELDEKDRSQAQISLQLLLYLQDFEQLRITQSLSEFEKCNKESLAKSLWLTHRNNVLV